MPPVTARLKPNEGAHPPFASSARRSKVPADQEVKSVTEAAILAAAAFAVALILTIIFAWHPGREVPQSGGHASNGVARQVQVTPDFQGRPRSLEQPGPRDATGAGPGQSAAR